jgi:putative Mn2+ efflux pump MntP
VLVIGAITAGLTATGMLLGRRVGARFGQRASVVGGLVLVGIGVKILVEHLTA